MIRKIGLYILSLWLLFLIIIIMTIDIPIYIGKNWEFVGISYLLLHNIMPILCIILILIGRLSYYDFNHQITGTPELSFEITKIESIEYEHLTFLTTYIIPFACFNFDDIRHIIVLVFLLIVIGIIYIKTDLYYANPTLAILQFRIYKVSGKFRNKKIKNDLILISRSELNLRDHVKYIKFDERIYFASKT